MAPIFGPRNGGNKVHADGEGGCLNCSSGDSGDGLQFGPDPGALFCRLPWPVCRAHGSPQQPLQARLARKRFCCNRLQRPALPVSGNSGGRPNATEGGEARGPFMPEESLRTALARSVVLACSWVASRQVFCSLAPPKGWQMRQFVVFWSVSGADGIVCW